VFEELAWAPSAEGELSLRRRLDPVTGQIVLEIKLGDEYLMSSQFVSGEVQLARVALADLDGDGWDVVVGGLGLGYTACAVLDDPRVGSLLVIDSNEAVIDWHRRHLVPNGVRLSAHPGTRLVGADFFAAVVADGLDPTHPGRRFDAVLVDIDHSPTDLLAPHNAGFYTVEGLRRLARTLRAGGVFGLWSNEPPDPHFCDRLREVFAVVEASVIEFDNPLQQSVATNTVYVARTAVLRS
jgi:spermidine synthase